MIRESQKDFRHTMLFMIFKIRCYRIGVGLHKNYLKVHQQFELRGGLRGVGCVNRENVKKNLGYPKTTWAKARFATISCSNAMLAGGGGI